MHVVPSCQYRTCPVFRSSRGANDNAIGTAGVLELGRALDLGGPAAIQVTGFGRICRWFLTAIGVHAKIKGVAYDQESYQ
jgi:hypothetical protein